MWASSLEKFVHFLEHRWLGEKTSLEEEENAQEFLDILRQFAVFEEKAPKSEMAKELIKELSRHFPSKISFKRNLSYEAFKILVSLGIFSGDQNLLLEKFQISESFSPEEEKEAENIQDDSHNTGTREDFRNLFTFSIDGEETIDFDDAISFEKMEDAWVVYIHISDVAHYVAKGSLLDIAAKKRRKTFYLIDQILTLFPENLSAQVFPLRAGKDSLALTTKVVFDQQYHLQSFEIFRSVIHVDKNYSYKEIEEFIHKKPNHHLSFLTNLLELCKELQKHRIEHRKGIDILLPVVSPVIQEDRISLKTYDPRQDSAFIIRELMILNNFLSAYYADQEKKDFFYLCQEFPKQEKKLENRCITQRCEFLELGGILQKSYLSLENIGHFALGVTHYTQITSPIRRYIDIVAQRQLKEILKGRPDFYTREELEEEVEFYGNGKILFQQLEDERKKYYLLKFQAKNMKEILSGTVIKILSSTECLVELQKTQIVCKIHYEQPVSVCEEVTVQLHSMYPRLGLSLGRVV